MLAFFALVHLDSIAMNSTSLLPHFSLTVLSLEAQGTLQRSCLMEEVGYWKPVKGLAVLVIVGLLFLAGSSARAEVLVSHLGSDQTDSFTLITGFAPASEIQMAKEEWTSNSNNGDVDPLAIVMATLVWGGDTKPSSGSTGGTTGGHDPGPSAAPEPATLLTGLVGSSLLGLFAVYRRRKQVGAAGLS
jgi:hypothetical protein